MIYRFKIVFEDEEDFERWIDIKTNASFFTFHNAIQEAIGFNKKEDATFFATNDNWKKLKEIKIPAGDINAGKDPIALHVNDPYQKFIYIADISKDWTLEVSLTKILDEEAGKTYPSVFKAIGKPPRQSGLLISEEELALESEQNAAGEKDDFELPGLGDILEEREDEDDGDVSLDDFPDLDGIDEMDFSNEA